MTEPIRFLDRASGELREEVVYGGAGVRLLYGTLPGRLIAGLLATRLPSVLYGRYLDSRLSRRKIRGFVAALDIDVDEATRPLEDYESFNAFFARELKDGARPLDGDPAALLSPADGRVWAAPIDGTTALPIKGKPMCVNRMLGRPDLAARFHGGAAVVVRLCPADYHRFHWPADGTAGESWTLPGPLHSVNPWALAADYEILDTNFREIALLETERFGALALVDVGAMFVGKITQTYTPGPVRRGDEKGYFTFGASTVVVLTEPGRVTIDADLLQATRDGHETFLRMGTRLGVALAT